MKLLLPLLLISPALGPVGPIQNIPLVPYYTEINLKARLSCKIWPAPMYSNQTARYECVPLKPNEWRNRI